MSGAKSIAAQLVFEDFVPRATRRNCEYIQVGRRPTLKPVRNRRGGEQRAKGSYGVGRIAERKARSRAMARCLLQEQVDELRIHLVR